MSNPPAHNVSLPGWRHANTVHIPNSCNQASQHIPSWKQLQLELYAAFVLGLLRVTWVAAAGTVPAGTVGSCFSVGVPVARLGELQHVW